jgi:hypothetical protein
LHRYTSGGGSGYPGSRPPSDPRATAAGPGRNRGDGGETAWVWDRGDGSRVPSRGDPHLADVLKSVREWGDASVAGGNSEAAMQQILDAITDPSKPGMPPGAQGAYPGGTYPGGGGLAGSWWNSDVDNYNDGSSRSLDTRKLLARWDVLPEVYEAININRASRVGKPASFSDMARRACIRRFQFTRRLKAPAFNR